MPCRCRAEASQAAEKGQAAGGGAATATAPLQAARKAAELGLESFTYAKAGEPTVQVGALALPEEPDRY